MKNELSLMVNSYDQIKIVGDGSSKNPGYSAAGLKIHCMVLLLGETYEFTRPMVFEHSNHWHRKKLLGDLRPFRNVTAITNAKSKKEGDTARRNAAQKVKLLERMCELLRLRVVTYPEPKLAKWKIVYEVLEGEPEPIIYYPALNTRNLQRQGVVDVIESSPLEDEKFCEALGSATTLRILQSSFYDTKVVSRILKEELEHGTLCKVKILLAQPNSQVAYDRSPTYGDKHEDQLKLFNYEIAKAVSAISHLAVQYNGKNKPGTDKEYKISLRLYYRTTAIPLYQCLDENGLNIHLLQGVFWHKFSSYAHQHLRIVGRNSEMAKTVGLHFKSVWDDTFNASKGIPKWQEEYQNHLRLQPTYIVDCEQATRSDIMPFFDKAEELRSFFPFKTWKEEPGWINFKCVYYNFNDTRKTFALRIAPKERLAEISQTHDMTHYAGVVVRLHSNYTAFLHMTDKGPTARVVSINIPTGGRKLINMEHCFALYGNNLKGNGSPYSIMMLLERTDSFPIAKDDLTNHSGIELLYTPILMERKMSIHENIWKKKSRSLPEVRLNYSYKLKTYLRQDYFNQIRKEIEKAQQEVYFLGYPPDMIDIDTHLDEYYAFLEKLIREQRINVYRILLNPLPDRKFVEHVGRLLNDSKLSNNFHLYVSDSRIPILNDLIVIDPDLKDNGTVIVSYIKEKKNKLGSLPLQMNVIKQESEIIVDLQEACIDYMESSNLTNRFVDLQKLKDFMQEKRKQVPRNQNEFYRP